ncbi:microtubule-actin cross-linking factor 1-like protein [Labeo rohita]|uniref:Microtubule-actin cross-linking factor 1-like protein n=1 Tax=Labeo rohita TaxID=84645 RepID=A0A498LB21_LABRO|nr:microtubule-actin cross-linking factor 1-like protein [Labeo rohita]
MGNIIPRFPESHGLSLLFMWKRSRTEVVCEGGSEEKRTRAVPASECHHEEGESEQVRKHITDLYEDLRDGHNLISLLEVLSGVTLACANEAVLFHTDLQFAQIISALICILSLFSLSLSSCLRQPREKGRMRFHRLQNVQIALDFLKQRQVKLVNIRNDDITDGNPKLTLGLIWTIILHFQEYVFVRLQCSFIVVLTLKNIYSVASLRVP